MPKQKAPRPTKTNTGDYLLDFDGTDFSQFGGQQAQQQEEPTFSDKVVNTGKAIAEGITFIPGQIADTLRDAYHGGNIDVTDTQALQERRARDDERAAYVQKYKDKSFEGAPDAMTSIGYSAATMGASLGAAALASPAGPVAAGAAGMAASGAMAYRATKQQFLQQMLGETEKVLGRLPTQDEWDKIATEFDGEATRYGAWEAGPEALSNLFMAKILGPLGKGLLRGSVGQGIKRIGGLYGEELATETATQMGQGQEEANVGLRNTAPGVWDAFKEIGPATFWQTTLMAGGKKGADMLANRMRARSQQVENNVDQTQQQGQGTTGLTNQAALPMAQGIFALPQGDGSIPMGSTDTGRGPIAAGVVAGQQPKPFLSDADHADTEAFVRAFEDRERNRDDEEALIEYGQRQARSPAQLALDHGENVDLLSLPQGNAAMAMGTEETGRGPIAPPTDYAGQPIATPYTPRPALPEQTSQSAGMGQWAGGRSQLAYGPKSEPQMMQGLGIMSQQGAPVQPQAMPTSSQIGNIQAAPRADTMAAASALGVPAPQAVPQEAQHPQALQRTQAMPNMADRMPEGGGLHTEPPVQTAAAKAPLLTPVVQERHKLLAMLPEAERKKARSMPLSLLRKKVDQVGMEAEAPDMVEKKAAPQRVSRIELIRQLPREEQGQYRDKSNAVILKRIQQLSEVAAEPTAPMAENVNAQLEENSGQIAPSDSAELPTAEQPETVSVGTPAVDPVAEPAPQPKNEPVQGQDKAPAKGPENVAENDATEKTAPAEAIKGNEKDKAQSEPEAKADAHDAKEKEERKPEKGHAKEARSQASEAQAFIDRYLDGGEGTIEDLEKAFREVKAVDPEAFSKLKGRISPYDRAERNLFEKVAAAKNDKQEVQEAADKKDATDAKGTEDAKRKDPAAKEPVPDKSADDKPSPDSTSGEQETASPKQSKETEGPTPKGIALKLGEHIGGSRADTASSSGKSPRRHGTKTQEDKTPAWRKRYDIVKAVNSDEWRLFDNRTKRAVPIWDRWNSEEEAEAALPLAVAKLNHYISKSDNGQQFAIKRKVSDRKRVIIKDGFKTLEEAGAYFEKNAAEILEAKTSLGEEILPAPKDVFREGPERRKGDVKPDDFLTDFGFRGAEFGKWNNQEERQDLLNHAYDGLMDLSDIIGVPPRALSLNGELGIAFGARGQGLSGARAHYEPGYAVINLTKMHGAGSLAHEWMHAMDNYFARQDGKTSSERKENARGDKVYAVGDKKMDYASHGFLRKDSGVRPEVQEAYSALVKAMYTKAEQYVEDTQKAERFVSGARDQLQKHIDGIRKGLDKKLEYRTRNAAPATSEQLAAFDGIVQRLVDGEDLNTGLRKSDGGLPRRKSNDLMDELAKLYKKVRGKSGFTDIYRGPIGDIGGLLARYKQRVEILESAKKENVQTKSVPTSYRMDARRLDEGRATDYWGTEHEMLSRAFSAYVEDKAEERGIRTDFLSYGSNNELPQFKLLGVRPYPEGKERTALNKAFDNLFTTLEAKETDKGVALASMAYHGSPHRFDKFIADHIGSGEGAQAFGYGLYFAGKKSVAEYYRRELAKPRHFFDLADNKGNTDSYDIVFGQPQKNGQKISINEYREAYSKAAEKAGQLYKVDIPEDHQLLLWDKPLSDQPKGVRKALEKENLSASETPYDADEYRTAWKPLDGSGLPLDALITMTSYDKKNGSAKVSWVPFADAIRDEFGKERETVISGADKAEAVRTIFDMQEDWLGADGKLEDSGAKMYSELSKRLGSDRAASEYLNSLGIKGIKYLDGSSRSAGEGSHNYVIFDDASINILQTYYSKRSGNDISAGQFLPKAPGARAGMRLEDVQAVADKIGKVAKNAATSRVVQSFDELPYSIRERYSDAKNSVEGVFDPRSGVVWLVADNLSDATRTAEVWAHEQIVHHGVRGLLPADARRRVLNQLWLGAGGMKNGMVKDIASRYGLAPTRSLQDRQTVMEEVIAALAEKKGQGLLERADGNLWRKVVSALHRAWNSLVRAVSGREGAMNMDNIDALLSALGRHVIDGESSGITQKAGPFEQAAAPASRSNNTVAEDPQHMASLAEDTTQLNEHLKRVFSGEGLAAGIRQTRKVLGRGVSDDVAEILSNPEMGKLFEEKDLSLFERLFKLPHWIAKDHAKFATAYNRQLERNDERNSATQKSVSEVPLLFDSDKKNRLNDKEIDELGKMIWQWDGKDIPELSWKKIEKFKEVDKTESGRPILEMNPDFYPAFEKWLEKQPQTKRVKDAFLQVRKSLDNDFLKAYAKMAAMSDLADTDLEMYRTGFGMLPNYFPHQRKGKYYVVATAGKGVVGDPKTVVYRKHFDVPVGSSVREEWAKIVAANKKDFPGAKWENPRESTALPDDILGAPIDMSAMEQLVKTAAGKLPSNEQAEEVKKILLTGLSDILKARGFGSHGIERQNIPGFDKDDIIGTLYSYKSGLNGWLTKMEAASDFAAALGKIDAKKNPRLWEYASQYIKDVLRNSDKIDRMAGNIKTVAFAWYLGANIKTVSVNVTQNLIIGVPRLEQYVTGGAGLWLKSAMDSIGLRYTTAGVSGTNKLTKDEQRLIQELYGDGVVTDAYMEELRGRLTKNPAEKTWNTFIKLMGYPMSVVERFNRASLALAAYRAATKGKLREKAAKELGLKPGEEMNYEQAKEFATMLVRDSHYEYGKSNAPEVFRSSVAGRMASPAYVFRSFGANTLNLYARALLKEGVEGRVFLAKSLGATIALGGLTAFPFYATLSALFGVGDDEDWTTKIRKALPKNDLLRDIVCYGVPSMAGFSIGGSLRMETPFTDGLRKGGSYQEVITQSLGGLIGIPYDMAVNRVGKAMEAAKYGETSRMIEALVPTAVSNAMQAYRLATRGQTSMKGKPINDPGTPGARKINALEAAGKFLGFQPISSAKSYDAYTAAEKARQVRDDKKNDLVLLALKSRDTGSAEGRKEMLRELKAWNDRMDKENRPSMKITFKSVMQTVAARRAENKPTKKNLQKKAEQQAVWH
ncbi:PLxRFG domain-containing protein [uncultured Desulfovibrio sp.]|uniref:PLxRFG domain-containing protein n=1 Tax=uncultured Desulfovibrio sp. TaxID=167968 RepID=UPI0028056C33|nr:PLxRFG domain-containing protein [uncultured Desulfovibrio sp.]